MPTYVSKNTFGILTSDGARIPYDATNGDYQEYLAYLANGGTEPADNTSSAAIDEKRFFTDVAVGSSNVYFGTSGRVLVNTSGVLSEIATIGTGSVALSDAYVAGLTVTTSAVTTADVTGTVNTFHYLDLSGLTANRTFNLPNASTAGQRCTLYILAGHATYSLIVSRNSSEVTRLFNNFECLSFIAISNGTAGWILDNDGRVPSTARLTYTGASGQSITSGSVTQVTLNSSSFETLGINDTTNSRLKIRRAGKYLITGNFRFASISATIPRMALAIRLTSPVTYYQTTELYAVTSTSASPGATVTGIIDLAAGDTIEMTIFQNSGSSQSPNSSNIYPTLAMTEILI